MCVGPKRDNRTVCLLWTWSWGSWGGPGKVPSTDPVVDVVWVTSRIPLPIATSSLGCHWYHHFSACLFSNLKIVFFFFFFNVPVKKNQKMVTSIVKVDERS